MPPLANKNTQTAPNDNPSGWSGKITPGRSKKPRTRLALLGVLLLWGVLLTLIIANHQGISDWWRLRGYQPPAAITQLAAQDTMDSYTQHLFYLNRPQLLSSVSSFRQHCPENKDTIVLGCYHPGQNGIYIYNVKDPALSGVTQVTAAHEVLHAIYARLSTKDRNNVDGLLESYYKNGLTNKRVKDEIALYQKTEPHDVLDEMHSTFGTEIASLPPPLEAYYKQYFTNRAAIVAYEQRYENEFTARQSTVANDDRQLTAMKQQIDSQQAALSAKLTQINADRSRLDGLKAAGQSSDYNDGITGYNAEVNAYNSSVASLQALIDSYNQLVATRNLVAGELTVLDKAVDTRIPQQSTR